MSEQKMPALPEATHFGWLDGGGYWPQSAVERIQREAYEAGRQQERERLEPLRVAVDDFYAMVSPVLRREAMEEVVAAARTLLEQTE